MKNTSHLTNLPLDEVIELVPNARFYALLDKESPTSKEIERRFCGGGRQKPNPLLGKKNILSIVGTANSKSFLESYNTTSDLERENTINIENITQDWEGSVYIQNKFMEFVRVLGVLNFKEFSYLVFISDDKENVYFQYIWEDGDISF